MEFVGSGCLHALPTLTSSLYYYPPSPPNIIQIAEVYQETWPICVEEHWVATYCKQFIDRQILGEFTGRDKYIRVIIKNKRQKFDTWYNTVVITMVSLLSDLLCLGFGNSFEGGVDEVNGCLECMPL